MSNPPLRRQNGWLVFASVVVPVLLLLTPVVEFGVVLSNFDEPGTGTRWNLLLIVAASSLVSFVLWCVARFREDRARLAAASGLIAFLVLAEFLFLLGPSAILLASAVAVLAGLVLRPQPEPAQPFGASRDTTDYGRRRVFGLRSIIAGSAGIVVGLVQLLV